MRRNLLTTSLLVASAGAVFGQEVQPLLGEPVPGLTPAQLQLFEEGRVAFATPLTEAEGLGPIFNDPGCGSCHNHPAQGGASTREITRFGIAGIPFDPLDALGGSLLQDQSLDIACREFVPASATVTANRVTPICFGAGLLESIPHGDIVANETGQPGHLAGFVSWVGDLSNPGAPPQPARFGWKGVVHNVITFSIDAGLNEMGLTSVFLPNENAPNGDLALLAACDTVADPEDQPDGAGFTKIDRFTHFQRYLAAPPQVPASGMTGEAVFNSTGCADCHMRSYTTGAVAEAALSGQAIAPYSDFLMHDMGLMGDQIAQGNASEGDMQTRALWGMRHRTALMHNGDVTGLPFPQLMDAAVAAHGPAAGFAQANYGTLSASDRDELHKFLASLGQAHFDYEDQGGLVGAADNDRDNFDWFFIQPLFTGDAPGTFGPDDTGAICDVDEDGDFDLRDFLEFQESFTGELVGVDPPTPLGLGSDVELRARGHVAGETVYVAPGGQFHFYVDYESIDLDNQGLAGFTFDLALAGGSVTGVSAAPGMDSFVSPAGVNNLSGFGGNLGSGIGGAQNTQLNSFAPVPNGTVATGLGTAGAVELLGGTLVAPVAPGTYTLEIVNPRVNVIATGTTGSPFWRTQQANVSSVNLTVVVGSGYPSHYCAGKVNSDGYAPEILWSGFPSMSSNCTIRSRRTVPGEVGIAIIGGATANMPFMGGTLCVSGFEGRGKVVTTLGGPDPATGMHQWVLRPNKLASWGLGAGDTLTAQWYMRDTAHPDGTTVGLSDAFSATIQP